MELLPEDKKVADLIAKLKNSNGGYPSDMLASRRQQYLRQVANAGLGIGIGTGIERATKSGGNASGAATTITSKILEIVLITAIVFEAGVAAYLYRGKIADLVRSNTAPSAQQAISQPNGNTASQKPGAGINLQTTLIVATYTPLAASSATPAPGLAGSNTSSSNSDDNNNTGSGSNTSVNVNATPGGTQGNQYGLTPKPERTKANDSSNNNNSGDGNDNGGGNSNNNGGGNDNGGNNNGGGGNNKKP